MKIKHTLKERLIFKYKWEEHPSRVDGHVEIHERQAVRLWVMIAILPLLVVLSPLVVIIAWFKITPDFVKFPMFVRVNNNHFQSFQSMILELHVLFFPNVSIAVSA